MSPGPPGTRPNSPPLPPVKRAQQDETVIVRLFDGTAQGRIATAQAERLDRSGEGKLRRRGSSHEYLQLPAGVTLENGWQWGISRSGRDTVMMAQRGRLVAKRAT